MKTTTKSTKNVKGPQKRNQTFEILNALNAINHIFHILLYIPIVNRSIIPIIIQVETEEDPKKSKMKQHLIKIYMTQ